MKHIPTTIADHPLTELITNVNGTEVRRLGPEAIKQLNEEHEFMKKRQEKRDKRLAKKEKMSAQYTDGEYNPWL